MYSRRLVHILFVALAVLLATRASWLRNDVEARQVSSSSADGGDSDAATSTPDDSSVASTTSDSPTTSASDTPTSSTSSDAPTSTSDEPTTSDTPTPTTTPAPTSNTDSSTSTSNTGPITTPPTSEPTSSASPTSSGDASDSETSDDTKSTKQTTAKPVTKTSTVFYTTTDSGGQTHVGSSEAVVVSTPTLSGGGSGGSGNSGITAKQRNIIIGVTVGVGSAIILAAAGVLYWRLRNKRRSQEENEELISYGAGFGGPGTAEKTEGGGSAAARSPFQSTLETYHAPTQTNAASNF
ncbi:hypothetical protein F5Y01DRAFT_287594 [Xylaria sp. FL0043]|nr:hypothetical protein F5Y01DRAFT_287594 [Xylaria sp. FL0043]